MTDWKYGGYLIREYATDHPPRHVHVFRDGRELDRWDIENQCWMDDTIGRHAGRALKALRQAGLAN